MIKQLLEFLLTPFFWLWRLHERSILSWPYRCDGGIEGPGDQPETTVAAIGWFYDSPDAGDPACVCSFCGLLIKEEDAPAIRMWDPDERMEARFHIECWQAVSSSVKPSVHKEAA